MEKDTDGDTLSDGDDVALGFSPLLQDTDGNGVIDCDEKVEKTILQSIEEYEKPEVTDVTVSFSGCLLYTSFLPPNAISSALLNTHFQSLILNSHLPRTQKSSLASQYANLQCLVFFISSYKTV